MSCPNCGQLMSLVTADKQSILHCRQCGGSFFEENGINRISLSTAQGLFQDKKTDEISGKEKKCPKDQEILKAVQTPAVPLDVTLLRCRKCRGIFAYPDDLIAFKQAQEAKINYFKTWKIPLPSLSTVVVSFVIIISSLFLSRYLLWQQGTLPSSASEIISNVYFSSSGPYLLLNFKTQIPVSSRIVFFDETSNQTIEKIISPTPKNLHSLVIKEINLNNPLTYQIILVDKNGREIKTERKKLKLK